MTPDPKPDLQYGKRIKRWTDLGILAIGSAGIACSSIILFFLVYLLRFTLTSLLWTRYPMLIMALLCGAAGTFLGLISCLAGTADYESHTDSKLGIIAIPLSIFAGTVALLFLTAR